MNGETLRQFAASVAIGGAVIAANWIFVAAPAQARLDAARTRLENASGALSDLNLPAGVDRDEALKTLRSRVRQIAADSSLATEPLRIYDVVLSLTDEHDVQVDRMDPTAGGGAMTDSAIAMTSFEIEVLGDLTHVLSFMDALEHEIGHTRIMNASIEPRVINEERLVAAIIRTRHFAFDLGEAKSLLDDQGGDK